MLVCVASFLHSNSASISPKSNLGLLPESKFPFSDSCSELKSGAAPPFSASRTMSAFHSVVGVFLIGVGVNSEIFPSLFYFYFSARSLATSSTSFTYYSQGAHWSNSSSPPTFVAAKCTLVSSFFLLRKKQKAPILAKMITSKTKPVMAPMIIPTLDSDSLIFPVSVFF